MLYSVLVEDRMYLIHYVWPGILNISTQVSTVQYHFVHTSIGVKHIVWRISQV